jgi:hypothetical protein
MEEESSAENVQAVAAEILQYLVAHPLARDTVEGVLKWWLPTHPVPRTKAMVQEALDLLVAQSRLTKRVITHSEDVYGANESQMEEIRTLVSEPGNKLDKDTV